MAAEAGGVANQPVEQAGMTPEVMQKLQDKATVLTQERKKRGRTVPEELTTPDDLRSFRTLASHPVSEKKQTNKKETKKEFLLLFLGFAFS